MRFGPAWGPDGTILFSPRLDVLAAVPAAGGPVTTILSGDPFGQPASFQWPRFLPDGRHFIFFGGSALPEHRGIYVGSLDSKEIELIVRNDFRAMYAPPGYLLYLRDETLMAQPFDAADLELSGEPVPIAEGIWFARSAAQASFSVSEAGDILAYVNASLWDGELEWFDRAGQPLGWVSRAVRYEGRTPQISPDGRRVAVARGEFGREDIWVLQDGGTAPGLRLTFTPESDNLPVWASDGHRIMYSTRSSVLVKDVDTGVESVIIASAPGTVVDWSKDGQFVVFERIATGSDLWVLRLDGDSTPFVHQETPFNETQAQLSPDGEWILYTSNETGRAEVCRRFQSPGASGKYLSPAAQCRAGARMGPSSSISLPINTSRPCP